MKIGGAPVQDAHGAHRNNAPLSDRNSVFPLAPYPLRAPSPDTLLIPSSFLLSPSPPPRPPLSYRPRSVIVTALLGTTAVFACFSAAALLTQRRSYLYLGGLLSSAVSLFMTMRFATWIFGGRALLFEAELYLGLLMFCGYVLFDTQVIVEKAANGVKDHVKDALSLFVDAIAIFVRVVVVLLRNAEKREAEQRNKRRRN